MRKAVNTLKRYLIRIPFVKKEVEGLARSLYLKRGSQNGAAERNWFEAEKIFYQGFFLKWVVYPVVLIFLFIMGLYLYGISRPYNVCLVSPCAADFKYGALTMEREGQLRIGILNDKASFSKGSLLYLCFPEGVEVQTPSSAKTNNWDCWQLNRAYFIELPKVASYKYANTLMPLQVKFPGEGVYFLRYGILGENLKMSTRAFRVKVEDKRNGALKPEA